MFLSLSQRVTECLFAFLCVCLCFLCVWLCVLWVFVFVCFCVFFFYVCFCVSLISPVWLSVSLRAFASIFVFCVCLTLFVCVLDFVFFMCVFLSLSQRACVTERLFAFLCVCLCIFCVSDSVCYEFLFLCVFFVFLKPFLCDWASVSVWCGFVCMFLSPVWSQFLWIRLDFWDLVMISMHWSWV